MGALKLLLLSAQAQERILGTKVAFMLHWPFENDPHTSLNLLIIIAIDAYSTKIN